MNKQTQITSALAKWERDKSINEFIRERLGLESSSGKSHAEEIIDNAIERAKIEEKPEWTKLLIETTKTEQKAQASTNIFFGAADLTNEALKKVIDVTPEPKAKSKIEELI